MSLIKWSPFGELEDIQDRLNRFLNETLPVRGEKNAFFADWTPPVDIEETDKEYLIKAELPDIKKEDVKVETLDGILTIEGERKQEKEEKGKKYHRIERAHGVFERAFLLPEDAQGDKVTADYKDGVLKVHVPKTEKATPKAIEVKVD